MQPTPTKSFGASAALDRLTLSQNMKLSMKQMLFVGGYKPEKEVLLFVSQDKLDLRMCYMMRAPDTVRRRVPGGHADSCRCRPCPSCSS